MAEDAIHFKLFYVISTKKFVRLFTQLLKQDEIKQKIDSTNHAVWNQSIVVFRGHYAHQFLPKFPRLALK